MKYWIFANVIAVFATIFVGAYSYLSNIYWLMIAMGVFFAMGIKNFINLRNLY